MANLVGRETNQTESRGRHRHETVWMAQVNPARRSIATMALFSAAAAQATPYTVNTLNDSNGASNCSLRDAINA